MLRSPGKNILFRSYLAIFFGLLCIGPLRADSEKDNIDSLFQMGKAYWITDPKKSLEISGQILELSDEIDYDKGRADGTYLKSMSLWFMEDYSESLRIIADATILYQKADDEIGVAGCFNSLGMIYHMVGADGEALEYFLKALDISRQLEYNIGVGKTLQNIGVVYRDQGDLAVALDYFQQSIPYLKRYLNKVVVGHEFANVALTYQLMQNYDSALHYYQMTYDAFKKGNNELGLIKYYEKTGMLYIDMGLPELAETNFNQGFALSRSKGMNEGITENGIGLIRAWDQLGKAEKSDSLIADLEPLVFSLQNPRSQMLWFNNMAEHYERSGNSEKSLSYLKESTSLKDSILGEEQKTKINQLRAVHNLETIQKENEILKENLAITKKMNLGVALALIIFLGLIIMISRFYSLKEKANKRLTGLNQQLRNQRQETEIKAQELQEANNTISSINSELEKIIGERTAELKKKNKKILDFAFFNSHQVRGSLARIMGLLEVFNEASGKKETQSVSELLKSQANELDDLIRDINKILAEEGYSGEEKD